MIIRKTAAELDKMRRSGLLMLLATSMPNTSTAREPIVARRRM